MDFNKLIQISKLSLINYQVNRKLIHFQIYKFQIKNF